MCCDWYSWTNPAPVTEAYGGFGVAVVSEESRTHPRTECGAS